MVASLAMSCALAITPFAVVDSFGFSRIVSHSIPNLKNISSVPNLSANSRFSTESGAGKGGSDASSSQRAVRFQSGEPQAVAGSAEGGNQAKEKAPDEASGEPYLMAENAGDRDGFRFAMSRHPLVLEKSGYRANNELPKGTIGLAGMITMLVDTPEPGSLFLLGTGLLGLALVLFWKSAKNTTRS